MADLPPAYTESQTACSTCAQLLDFASKKPEAIIPLQQPCCGRWVCSFCIDKNPRFATYCPFCPASTRILPPSYAAEASSSAALPPEYSTAADETKAKLEDVEDVIHFVRATDTLPGLALLYNVPLGVLRSHNRLWSDHLLVARSAVSIPASHYRGGSHSPAAEEGDDKKCLLKRFQITTKCVDVKMAEAYLDAAGGRLEEAVETWRADEGWVREQEERERRGKGIVSGRGMMWPW